MRNKKVLIGVGITLAIIASCLSGCSCSTQNELYDMINRGEQIEIEVSEPDFEINGTESKITWVELGKLMTYPDYRVGVDNALGITSDSISKYGVIYIDAEGNQTSNATLYNAFMNKAFLDKWNTESIQSQLNDGISTTYADLEDSDYTAAIINAYFNLIDDNEPNYFNGGASLSRAEAMTMLMRAVTPVEDLKANENFKSLVGDSEYTSYASYMDSNCFINSSDKSISEQNFNGAMTRAEFVYMVMNQTFGKEAVSKFDSSKVSLNDCKNAGDIATTEKFSGKDYCNSYVLTQMIKNPEAGATTSIYKALAMAKEYGVISAETRWDEAITKTEGIEIIISAFEAYVKLNGSKVEVESGELKDYTEEAKALYESNKSDWSCTEDEFITNYNKYSNQGLTSDQVAEQMKTEFSTSYKQQQSEEESQIQDDNNKKDDEGLLEDSDTKRPSNQKNWEYQQRGLMLGWNTSETNLDAVGPDGTMAFYVYENGDIYFMITKEEIASFDINNPNPEYLNYVGEGNPNHTGGTTSNSGSSNNGFVSSGDEGGIDWDSLLGGGGVESPTYDDDDLSQENKDAIANGGGMQVP